MAYSGTRAEAKERGEHLYFTGKPCVRGHAAARFTRTAICVDCNREQSRAWGRSNADKKRGADAAYRKKNADKKRASDRAYREANREAVLEKKREYYARTLEARRSAAKKWREANPDKPKAGLARFRKANPHKINAWAALRRARKTQAKLMLKPEHVAQMERLYARARELTAETGVRHEVDHIHPLVGPNFSGLHVPWNLQILTSYDNKRKGNKLMEAV